jgi:hypothetical protein
MKEYIDGQPAAHSRHLLFLGKAVEPLPRSNPLQFSLFPSHILTVRPARRTVQLNLSTLLVLSGTCLAVLFLPASLPLL